jgi:Mn2+/Fe2+ NRAMP family transporter
MKKAVEVALGIVTSIGGFLEIGSITTAAQAGAQFGYQLLWAVLLGGACIAFLVEQAGRLTAVSGHTISDAIRERFGYPYFLLLLVLVTLVTLLVLGAELGGICIALEFATGIGYRWWVVPAVFVSWLLLWKGKFSIIEQGLSLLGLVTVCFVVAVFVLGPDWHAAAEGLAPTLPQHDPARYWFLAVNILGASITPSLMFFYSSGAKEDKWDASFVGANRAIAAFGMGFGTTISMAVLIVAAMALLPLGIRVEDYSQLGLLLTEAFGHWGFVLVAASLAIACLGATVEIALAIAYLCAQGLGWNWGEDRRPRDAARFSTTYTLVLVVGALIVLSGIDPLRLTNFSMALTAATLPIAVVPFLFLMNDANYVKDRGNGWFSNAVVLFIVAMAFVLAVVTLRFQILGG